MDWDSRQLVEGAASWNFDIPPVAAAPGGAASAVEEGGRAITALAAAVTEALYDGPGVALLHGAPVADEATAAVFLRGLGAALGHTVPQDGDGSIIGRVEDVGASFDVPTHRGHRTSAALPFHSDRTDVVALLCVRNAATGGRSQIASAQRVRAILAHEAPDLLDVLESPFPYDRRGEEGAGEAPWTPLPVFTVVGDRVVARYIRRFIESSQRHDDAPRLTTDQLRAMDAVDAVLSRPDVVHEMDLAVGQVQLIENHAIMHARTAFHGGGRLLLRLWLSTPRSPQLPGAFRPVYGSVAAGTVRGGVWPPGTDDVVGRQLATVGPRR